MTNAEKTRSRKREKEITDNSRCLQLLSFRVVFMANLTRAPLTYLNGGKDAPRRARARLRSRLSRYLEEDDARDRVLNAISFSSSYVARCLVNDTIPYLCPTKRDSIKTEVVIKILSLTKISRSFLPKNEHSSFKKCLFSTCKA